MLLSAQRKADCVHGMFGGYNNILFSGRFLGMT